jgi:tetratricopeptide (TPR) repeat protein
MIKRPVVIAVAAAAIVAAVSFVWLEVRQEREFRRLVAVGDAALAGDQTYVAIEAFSGALVLKPASMLAHLKRGDAYRRRGEFDAALRDLREASTLDPTAPQPLELLGDVNGAMGRHQRAAELYQRYIQLDDRATRVLYKLAAAQVRQRQSAKAIETLRKAVALDAGFAEAHYLLGMTLRTEKRHSDALRALTRAVQLNTSFIAAREELADLYAELGRVRERIEQLEALAALEPGRAERLVAVGLTYARYGRPEAAILTLGRAAERYPDAPAVHAALGRVWLDTASAQNPAATTRAIEALERAANTVDATSDTLTLYGRALLLSGDAAAAERVLQQAVARLPVEPAAYRYLADAANLLGHIPVARTAQERYAALALTR